MRMLIIIVDSDSLIVAYLGNNERGDDGSPRMGSGTSPKADACCALNKNKNSYKEPNKRGDAAPATQDICRFMAGPERRVRS